MYHANVLEQQILALFNERKTKRALRQLAYVDQVHEYKRTTAIFLLSQCTCTEMQQTLDERLTPMVMSHKRSKNNADANPGFEGKVQELLARTPEQLGFRDSCKLPAADYNRRQLAEKLRDAALVLMAEVNAEDPWITTVSIQDQLWPVDNLIKGRNPLTACGAQWVNDTYPQGVEGAKKFCSWVNDALVPEGCSGIEEVIWRFDRPLALLTDDALRDQYVDIHGLLPRVDVLSVHCWGQCVTDPIRLAHKNLIPEDAWGEGVPVAVTYRAGVLMMAAAVIAKRLGLNDVLHGFCGGAGLWETVYDFARSDSDIDDGLFFLRDCWNPILDFMSHIRMVHGLEVHGTEGPFDFYSFQKSCATFGNRPEWGAGHDGSHYRWQGIDDIAVLHAVAAMKRLYHMHFKSVKFDQDPLAGIMRGLQGLNTVGPGGGWYFETIGNGHDHKGQPENLGDIADALVQCGYNGNVSAENEKPGANPEEQMTIAIRNINAALYARGEIVLPDK